VTMILTGQEVHSQDFHATPCTHLPDAQQASLLSSSFDVAS
jgi:hypothetical protein